MKYDKQVQQGKAAFSERNPQTTQQKETAAEPWRITKKRTWRKAEYGQDNHINDT
jgi:hypothetical protein